MKTLYLGVLTLTLASMGCGGGGGDDLALADMPRELAQVSCEKYFGCCPQDSAVDYTSVDECITDTQFVTSLLGSALQASENAGRARYDAARAAECMDVISGLACNGFDGGPFACLDFIVPLVDEGGECEQDYECTTGYCEFDTGLCLTLPALGETCSDTCAEGSYCEFAADGTGTCAAVKADGETCFLDEECLSDFCYDDGAGASTCAEVLACM